MTELVRRQLLRYGPVALVLMAFVAAYLVNAQRLRDLGTAALRSFADAQWSTYQAEFELQRLLMAVDRYTLGDSETSRADVMERIEILWSRLPALVEGSESRLLREKADVVPVVERLQGDLEAVEKLLTAAPAGSALRLALRERLEPHVGPMHQIVLQAVHSTNGRQAELQRRVGVLSENHLIAMLGVIGATLVLGGLLLRDVHGARQLLLEASRARDRVTHLANHDSLTGLPNRRLFEDRLAMALARTRRTGEALALHLIDIDGFKQVNDRLGHAAGDCLLIHLAGRLRTCMRETDTLARLGGDELAVLQVGIGGAEDARALAARLTATAHAPLEIERQPVVSSVSIGVALAPADARDRATLMRHADRALYAAKAEGRNGFVVFADTSAQRPISITQSGPEEIPNVLAKSP
jgi:diguanylate cyclase (GGDEF)-like protein